MQQTDGWSLASKHLAAMVSIIDLLKQCKLLAIEARHPQQWYKSTSARLRDASGWIQALLDRDSPYLDTNNPKTAETDWTLVDPRADGEDDPKTSANFQKIAACQRMNSQRLSEQGGAALPELQRNARAQWPLLENHRARQVHWQPATSPITIAD